MNRINNVFVPTMSWSGKIKQMVKEYSGRERLRAAFARARFLIKAYSLQVVLACIAALVCMWIILVMSDSSPKGPVVQALSLPIVEPSSALPSSTTPPPMPLSSVPAAAPLLANSAPEQATQTVSPPAVAAVVLHQEEWKVFTVRSRDNATRFFNRLGLNPKQLHEVLAFVKKKHLLNPLKPGQSLRVLIDTPQQQLKQLDYPLSTLDILTIKQTPQGFTSTVVHRKPIIALKYAANTVHGSLSAAANKAGLPSNLATQLNSIFASDPSFAKSIHSGDKFCLLYEAFYLDGKKIGTGNILEAEVTTRAKVYRAVRYTNPKGVTNYYTPQGLSLQRAFIRNPVKYSHISSLFSFNRYHPLLHIARAHQGVDFAAPRGTPIKATADGKITFMGYKGSYGNAIMLHHGGAYSTLYGHMMSFATGLRRGAFVHQNQVIGYVGSTGLASGPHLHYEFLVNGVHRDPLTVALPSSRPISPSYRAEFLSKARAMMAKLAVYRQQS